MDIAIKDYRKKPRYYILREDAISDEFLPEPSPTNWREVQREDFVPESVLAFLERSK